MNNGQPDGSMPALDIRGYKPTIIDGRYFNRYLALLGFIKGRFSLSETVALFFLPGMKRSKEVNEKRYRFQEEYWKKKMRGFLNEDGSIDLFSKPFFIATQNHSELASLLREIVLTDQYMIGQFMKDGDTVIDIGGNIGMFSVKAAHDFPHAKIIAFEPSKKNFAVLKKNTAPYPGITCINQGLGDRAETQTIVQPEFGAGGARLADSPLGALPESNWEKEIREDASIVTLDSLNFEKVDFIKIDTEGYESKVLAGAAETIRRCKPIISMSAYHRPEDKEELPKLLRSISPDYVCELMHADGENFICRVASA